MSDETGIISYLKSTKSTFLFRSFKPFFYMPTCKCDFQQFIQRFCRWRVTYKIFDFTGPGILGYNQPVSSIRRNRAICLVVLFFNQIYLSCFYLPYTLAVGSVFYHHCLPLLTVKRLTTIHYRQHQGSKDRG